MFPYPSGAGLHVGHPEGYTATDILCRYKRMRGFNVLHPMGWDAFGLPAEQYAIKTGTHPRITTQKNIDTFRRQIKSLGFSYDWDREVDTTDPDYFKWTQWIFLQLFDTWYDPDSRGRPGRPQGQGPADRRAADPATARPTPTPIATRSGWPIAPRSRSTGARRWARCWPTKKSSTARASAAAIPVVRMPLRQWMLRITAYAERLLDDLEIVDWPEPIKDMQRNWIGRSEGAEVDFFIGDDLDVAARRAGFPRRPDDVIRVFTTRPDTLFGATYMVLAPEHPLVDRLTTPEQRDAVAAYREQAAAQERPRAHRPGQEEDRRLHRRYAINPVNGERSRSGSPTTC